MKSRIAMTKAAFKKKNLSTSKLDLNVRKKDVKCYIWNIDVYVVEYWILRKINKTNRKRFNIWCWKSI
jgi:hypothetical protein